MVRLRDKSVRRTSLIVRNAPLVNEATVHMKNGNYNKAILLYDQVSFNDFKKSISLNIFFPTNQSNKSNFLNLQGTSYSAIIYFL